jgi:hypothetical protein
MVGLRRAKSDMLKRPPLLISHAVAFHSMRGNSALERT